MNEEQADRVITDIESIAHLLRALQHEEAQLTEGQKDELSNMPENKREEQIKQWLAQAEEKKLLRRMELIRNLEDIIRRSGLPADTQTKLLAVLQTAKDNNWKLSPQVINRIDTIKQEDNTKKEREEQARLEAETKTSVQNTPSIATVAAVAAVGTVLLAKTPEHTINFAPKAQVPTEELVMAKAPEKFKKVANKAIETIAQAVSKPVKDITLDDIYTSSVMPVQKRYARAQYLKDNPAVAKDMKTEMQQITQIANQKADRRRERKQARREGRPLQQDNNPKYMEQFTDEEKLLIKRVNKIKQRGKAITMEEIKNALFDELVKVDKLPVEQAKAYVQSYDTFMRRQKPDLFVNQKREQARLALKAKLEQKRDDYKNQLAAVNNKTQSSLPIKMRQEKAQNPKQPKNELEKPKVNLHLELLMTFLSKRFRSDERKNAPIKTQIPVQKTAKIDTINKANPYVPQIPLQTLSGIFPRRDNQAILHPVQNHKGNHISKSDKANKKNATSQVSQRVWLQRLRDRIAQK